MPPHKNKKDGFLLRQPGCKTRARNENRGITKKRTN
jgi:hypothetical protein